jgi:hypothetical protein
MSLDGLRAWIGEVERQLGMRTRAFLVLVAIAIGGAGTAIYLAAEAQNDQVSEGDLQAVESALQARIEALEASSATGTSEADGGNAVLEAQVQQLQAKVEALESSNQGNSKGSKQGDSKGSEAQGSKSGGEQAPSGSEKQSDKNP